MKQYKTLKLLGKGSFGSALLVEDRSTGKQLVAKEIMVAHLSTVEAEKAKGEAELLQRLNHTNIISFVASFVEGHNLYIIMEYADGGDLSATVKKKKKDGTGHFSEDEVMSVFVQICLGLKNVHRNKILHRDLKSQNVFMTKTGIVKLGDFGIAKVLEHTADCAQTQIGTPFYLSPEICRGEPYERKSDIWALGVILYEMFSLRLPFEASNLPQLIQKISGGTKPLPLPAGVYSEEAQLLVFQLLHHEPAARPSATQVRVTHPPNSHRRPSGDPPLILW